MINAKVILVKQVYVGLVMQAVLLPVLQLVTPVILTKEMGNLAQLIAIVKAVAVIKIHVLHALILDNHAKIVATVVAVNHVTKQALMEAALQSIPVCNNPVFQIKLF